MIGSPFVGAWIAQITFWILIVVGIGYRALTARSAALFVALWLAGYLAVPRITWWAWPLVTSYMALLDIVLVFIVFKGDVRIS